MTLPAPDEASWPVNDVLALHGAVNEQARELALEHPWHVRLYPAGDEYEEE